MEQTISLSTNTLPVALATLFIITVIPVKLGASFVGSMIQSFGPAALGTVIGLLAWFIFF
jgi:hypothetical protein